jgi:asparagine synthase (glutamine-hydrolysing)
LPGLTLITGSDVDTTAAMGAVSLVARPNDVIETLLEIPRRLLVAWAAPEGYPRTTIGNEYGLCVLEGTAPRLSASVLENELKQLLARLNEDATRGFEAACRWASHTEGDFLLLLVPMHGERVVLATDALGRLRPFLHEERSQLAIAREIKTLVALYGPGKVDRLAIAEILTFGFPLGMRTPVASVQAMAPGAATQIQLAPFRHRTTSSNTWDFESLIRPHKPKVIKELAECLEATCTAQTRAEPIGPILSLSGGLDSRAVAAAFARSRVPFNACTFETADGAFQRDVPIAREVAQILGAPWRLFASGDPTWEDCVETVTLRDGLNPMSMATAMAYLKHLRREYGARTVFTGDGGDRVLVDLRAPWWVDNFEAFIKSRLEQTFWPLREAAALVGLDERSVRDAVVAHFETYPERSARYREIHFLIMEKTLRWLFEGEERNRSFLWHQTPFYGKEFFNLAMSVHPKEKQHDRLRTALIKALEPRLANVPTLRKRRLAGVLHRELPPEVRAVLRRVRRYVGAYPNTSHGMKAIPDELTSLLKSGCAQDVFVGDLAEALSHATPGQYNVLATQVLYISRTWGLGLALL